MADEKKEVPVAVRTSAPAQTPSTAPKAETPPAVPAAKVEPAPAPPPATPEPARMTPPEPPAVAPANVRGDLSGKEVVILPIKTEGGIQIGPHRYSFKKGVKTMVPREIVDHLIRVGIVAPAIE
jgi:hypothetical protein